MLEASFTFQAYVQELSDAQLEALLFDAHAEKLKRHEQKNRQTTADAARYGCLHQPSQVTVTKLTGL
jgi:hypothetical protein